ncbi:uncharacterized protein LOC9640241 [Selaginella moellendorffii]|uniref:uncharacterized protein LOC9640241 n=1 Tax=Selaginella moellendorffii TaxID=88036 RepID=UPI000D1C7895|nr:uncharacterized protein LOC9640241 [Selaginella moellendorffii]|eukprot:XP_024532173.1 uncharacterized protein LOC9640241 [Selaginella moellendorffii]
MRRRVCGRVSCCSTSSVAATKSRTQRIMDSIAVSDGEAGGAGGASTYQALKRLDDLWFRLRSRASGTIPEIVTRHDAQCPTNSREVSMAFDVVVCGGTLGIFFAAALALKGFKVAVVEKNVLRGRAQEWNISRKEIQELVDIGLITPAELESVISAEFNPNRCGFDGGSELWVKNILNLGISPARLIETLKKRFVEAGGVIIEGTGASKIAVYNDCAIISLDDARVLLSRLVLDAMGNFSPIVRQIRRGCPPDGVCLVVGSCARGFHANTTSDIIYTNSPFTTIKNSKTQYFWEAFPAGSGPRDRTTYMFSYMDATASRPSLEDMLEDYWDRMPEYQAVKLEDLEVLRVLFGIFPTYRSSPLPAAFDRVLQVGDASGIQSPVSFGGFASIARNLQRLSNGITEALEADKLDKNSLSLLNPYMPNLSGAWLLQKAMSVRPDAGVSSSFINELLSVTFESMEKLGDPVLRPFLQDVIQFFPLAMTLGSIMLTRPSLLPQIFKQVGLASIADWMIHFASLGLYTMLSSVIASPALVLATMLPKNQSYFLLRIVESWRYGAGLDHKN